MRPIAISGSIVIVIFVLWLVAFLVSAPFGELFGNLVFGWLMFLGRVSAQLTVNWSGVATAAACIVLILCGLHAFLRWLASAVRLESDTSRTTWKLRWTASIIGVTLLMFVAGLAFIGIAHQVAWLATSTQPHVELRVNSSFISQSKTQLQMLALAVQGYDGNKRALPPQGEHTAGKHSWLTAIMPYSMLGVENIDMDLDWDHPNNAPAFQRVVPTYLNPAIAPFRNAEGYAVSHYAGNVHVLGSDQVTRSVDVKDGHSNTILAGEVAANFKAWGDPTNLRDASTGLNNSPDGFGSPSGEGALLLMLDGSVKPYAKKTSPKVLRAMSLPNDESGARSARALSKR